MVVLVTGGSGFIGSHVVDWLVEKSYTVRVFDKVKPLNDKAEWHKGDLTAKGDVNEAVVDVETVFHLAAIADVNVATTDPELCLRINELGTLNLLEASSGHEVDRIIHASTVWVYGKASEMVTEETPIPPPNDIYTQTKIGQEYLTHSWSQMHSLPYTILRYDIPYGPRMRSNMAISTFVRRAINKEPVTVYGDGNQGRCWIYVTDLAEGNCLAMKESARNQIINLAGRDFVTISEIVEILTKKLGKFSVQHRPPRPGDFRGVRTSIDKAKKLLDWTPMTSFEEGLTKYLELVRPG